MADINVMWRK